MRKTERTLLRRMCLVLVLFIVAAAVPLAASADEEPTEEEMHAAFIEYMNVKAEALGMTETFFNDPIGMNNTTTARDYLKLLVHADTYETLAEVWAAEEYTVTLGGDNPREKVVRSTIRGNDFLDPFYTILACKDGELTALNLRNLVAILEIPESEQKLAVVALGAYGRNEDAYGSRAAVRQIADAAMLCYTDPLADNSSADIPCQCAIACLIPEEGADPDNLQILFEKNADTLMQMASITKVMTAVCLLDIQQNLEETFSFSYYDTRIGGFYDGDFYVGETLTYRDALYALLLPSSNITARALAREAGNVILEEGIPEPTIAPEIPEPTTEPENTDPTLPQREPPHLR